MSPALVRQLDELIRQRAGELGVPGVAVGVVGPGIEHRLGVGHPTPGDARPVDATTLFQIGSVSKPLTSLLVDSLLADGLLEPHTRLSAVLGDHGLPDVTITDLLAHRFGIDGDALLSRPPDPPTPEGAVAALERADRLGTPGGPFSYSNAAYSVLGRVVEVVDSRPFAESLRRRVTRPLRMRRTVTTADEAVTGVVALPHQSHPDGAEPIPGGMGWQPRWELGAHDTAPAGIISCLDDLLGLISSLLDPDAQGRTPMSADRLAALWEPVVDVGPGESMASGWLIRSVGGVTVVGHPGVTAGYCTLLSLVPSLGLGWIVLTNGTAGSVLHGDVDELLLRHLAGVVATPDDGVPSGEAGAAAGRYVGGLGVTTITAESPGSTLSMVDEPRDDGRWQPFPSPPATVERRGDLLVGTDADGRPVSVPLVVDGDRVVAIRRGRRLRERQG
ncbi:MAG: serine hydrolase domain-containing protein [Actinomycetota bacterium]